MVDEILIGSIKETYRKRVDLHRAEKRLVLQMKAVCRRFCDGSKTEGARLYAAIGGKAEHPRALVAMRHLEGLVVARDAVHAARSQTERELLALAKQLPIAPWVEATAGLGLLSIACVIGETGDLDLYSGPAKVWKRMGLACDTEGLTQKEFPHETYAEAYARGYVKSRRAVMYVLGAAIVKCSGSPYRDLYLDRRGVETDKAAADGLEILDLATAKARKATGTLPERYATAQRVHMRAQRYIEKRVLRDLWRAWRAA
jgi:hypothetical protein